jgi:hypothetical protein
MDEGTIKSPIPKCRLYWSFLFGNFVGSESGQKQSVKLLHAEDGLQQNSTPPNPTATYCLYTLYVYFGKGARIGEVREKVEGQQLSKEVENTYLQSTNSIKHQ